MHKLVAEVHAMLQQDEVISRLKHTRDRDVLNGECLGDLDLSG